MSGVDLLPGSSGGFEEALAGAMSDTLPVLVREAIDPAVAPVSMLPFLAAHESVRLWFSDWSEQRKRDIIADWPALGALIGTRAATQRFLDYVDAEILHKISYPARKPVGRISAGRRTPIQIPAFTAQYLVKVELRVPRRTVCVGRTAVGKAAVRTPNRTPLHRVLQAVAIAKGPATAKTVNFAHRVPRSIDEGLDIGAGYVLGEFKNRVRL